MRLLKVGYSVQGLSAGQVVLVKHHRPPFITVAGPFVLALFTMFLLLPYFISNLASYNRGRTFTVSFPSRKVSIE